MDKHIPESDDPLRRATQSLPRKGQTGQAPGEKAVGQVHTWIGRWQRLAVSAACRGQASHRVEGLSCEDLLCHAAMADASTLPHTRSKWLGKACPAALLRGKVAPCRFWLLRLAWWPQRDTGLREAVRQPSSRFWTLGHSLPPSLCLSHSKNSSLDFESRVFQYGKAR